MRLATWNLLAPEYAHRPDARDFYRHAHPWDEWDRRRPRLVAGLLSMGADALCLQEVSGAFWADELEAALGGAGYAATFCGRPAGDAVVGTAVAWRVAAWEGAAAPLLAGTRDAGRACAAVLRPAGGGPALLVASVHLAYSHHAPRRRKALDRVLAELDRRAGDGAQVLAGDFNFDPRAHAAWGVWEAAGWRTTHPDPALRTWAADGHAERVDAILHRGRAACAGASPTVPLEAVPGLPSAEIPSDHVPLWADLRVSADAP